MRRAAVILWFHVLTFFLGIHLLSHETISFLHKCLYSRAEPFNLEYVIRFYKPKKKLSGAIFTIKILVAKTFGLGRQLKDCLAILHV